MHGGLCRDCFDEAESHGGGCQCHICRHLVAAEDVVEFKLMEVVT